MDNLLVLQPKGRYVQINNCCMVYENGVVVCGEKVIKPTVTPTGLMIRVNRRDCKLNKMLHTIVAEAFVAKPNDEYHYDVRHKNGNLFDNRAENLEWKRRGSDLVKKENKESKYKSVRKNPILQVNPKNMEIIKEYSNLKEAAVANGFPYSALAEARAKREVYRGYLWVKKDDYYNISPKEIISIEIDKLKVKNLQKFLRDIQQHIFSGTLKINIRGEDKSYLISNSSIKEINIESSDKKN